MRASLAAALIGLGACNSILGIGDVHPTAGADAPVNPDAMIDAAPPTCLVPPPGSVIGCWHVTYVKADRSQIVVGKDLTRLAIKALVPDPGGGFHGVDAVSATADGVFRIDQIPDGV